MPPIPTRPFRERPWRGEAQQAADAFWAWHLGLARPPAALADPDRLHEAVRAVQAGERPGVLDGAVEAEALRHAEPLGDGQALLAQQLEAAAQLAAPVRFETATAWAAFVDPWAGAHASLLGGLADLTAQYQRIYLRALGRAFFATGRLVRLQADARDDRLFFPAEDLDTYGVQIADLRSAAPSEGARRLVWKQVVRARDAFAEAQPLMREVRGRSARALRLWMAGGLEVLGTIERRDYDVWSRPIQLSPIQQAQVRLLGVFGRKTFKTR